MFMLCIQVITPLINVQCSLPPFCGIQMYVSWDLYLDILGI